MRWLFCFRGYSYNNILQMLLITSYWRINNDVENWEWNNKTRWKTESCVQDSMHVRKGTTSSSTCSQNQKWDKKGWSGSYTQGRTVEETKDLTKFDDQSTWQYPQLRCWSIHWHKLESPFLLVFLPSFNSLTSVFCNFLMFSNYVTIP